jgi:hypothetical protein
MDIHFKDITDFTDIDRAAVILNKTFLEIDKNA